MSLTITEDIELTKQIYSVVEAGIVDDYEYFCYEIEVNDGYMKEKLTVENDGKKVAGAKSNFNKAILYDLVKTLKCNFTNRGENWKTFVISYRRGDEVKVNFKY